VPVAHDPEAEGAGNAVLALLDAVVLELDDPAA
jgi:hypothetical protein